MLSAFLYLLVGGTEKGQIMLYCKIRGENQKESFVFDMFKLFKWQELVALEADLQLNETFHLSNIWNIYYLRVTRD